MVEEKNVWGAVVLALVLETAAACAYALGNLFGNFPVNALSWVGVGIASVLMAWSFFRTRGSAAFLKGLLCGLVYTAVTAGLSTLVAGLFGNERYALCLVALFNFLYCILFIIPIGMEAAPSGGGKAIAILLIFCFLSSYLVGFVPGSWVKNGPDYLSAIWDAMGREGDATVPEEACVRTEPDYDRPVKLLVNIDETTQVNDYEEYLKTRSEITAEDLAYYVKPYYDTGVTDLIFSVCGQSSATPTDVLTWRGDKLFWTEENGKKVDYSATPWWWFSLQEKGIDPVPYWLDACRENGIRPWLSVRMNDCHDSGEETSPLRGELFYTAQQNGWMIGEEYGYYHTCLDYSVPQVREIMLSYIEEQILRYDVYGLELDWMREIYCFDYLHEDNEKIVGIMNDFVRNVYAVVQRAEDKWGHDIKITARLMRDLDQCKIFGFDARTWNNERLVDSITVTPRFNSCDSDMNINAWKTALQNVEIYAGIETLVRPDGNERENAVADAQVARGYAAEYLAENADGVYLFNYMALPYKARNVEIYNSCGDLRKVYSMPRRHVMTNQDIAPKGSDRYVPLPVAALKGKPATLVQKTGFIPSEASVVVYLGFANKLSSNDVTVTVNGGVCSENGTAVIFAENESGGAPIENGYLPEGSYLYQFTVNDLSLLGNPLYVTVENNKIIPVIVTYLEIEVRT